MIKAIIFDMDGVISDTQKLHSKVEAEILNRYGIDITPNEITKKYSGVKTSDFFHDLLKDKYVDVNLLLEEKWKKMINLARENVPEIDGSTNLINLLKEDGFSLAVASASRMEFIKLVLFKLKLEDKFEQVVSADEVKNGKPAPDIFLLAAKKLNKKPEECLVIEDGISGMEGARNAKMKCIGLVQNLNEEYPADILVTDLKQISLEKIYGI